MIDPRIIVVIPARNEKENIIRTLDALGNQSIHPKEVIVVDDGSKDNTLQLLKGYESQNFKLIVKSRKNRRGGKSFVGTPAIATTFNVGFKEAKKYNFDYLMVLGADTILEKKYIERLVIEFSKDTSLAIVSGQSCETAINPTHARGSGRMIDYRFWRHYGEHYPVIYGWEDDCLIQCQRLGLKVVSFPHILFKFTRKDQGTLDFMNWGRAARAMNYHPVIAILRAIRFLLIQYHGIKGTQRFLAGYMSVPIKERLNSTQRQNRDFLRHHQVIQIPLKLISILEKILKGK